MKRWALMNGDECVNVVEQAEAPELPGDWEDVTGLAVGPGHSLLAGQWTPPSTRVAVVSMYQARRALLEAGYLDDAEAAIEALPEPDRKAAQVAWEFRPTVRRDSALVQQIGAAIGLSESGIDDLFIAADAIS